MVSSTSGEVIRAPGLNVWDTGNGGILLFHVQPELHPSLECWGVFQVSVEGLEGAHETIFGLSPTSFGMYVSD